MPTLKRYLASIYLISVAIAASSQAPKDMTPQNVDLSFAQGAHGNCPLVAITKWAIATYGVRPTSGILSVMTNADTSESVTLADGTVVTVTQDQKKLAASYSDFDSQEQKIDSRPSLADRRLVIETANRLYAVLAIREREGAADGRNVSANEFKEGLSDLQGGGSIDSMYEYLGFEVSDLDAFPNAVPNTFGSAGHVVFVLNEKGGDETYYRLNKYDEHGHPAEIASYNYRLGRGGHRWRYALATGPQATQRQVVVRQCEDNQVWKACKYKK